MRISKQKIIFLFLIISLLVSTGILEAARVKLKVKVAAANIREAPIMSSKVIFRAPQGAILESEIKEGEWYKVSLSPDKSGQIISGFIHRSVVEVVEEIKEVAEAPKEEAKKAPELKKKIEEEKEKEREEVSWVIYKKPKEKREAKREKTEVGKEEMGITGKGFKFGINIASLSMSDGESAGSKMGFCLGGFVAIGINRYIEIQPELLFTKKGGKEKGYGYFSSNEIWNLSYLEFPLLVKLKIPAKGLVRPDIFVGPYCALKLGGSKKPEGEEKESTFAKISEGESIEELKSFDFGLVFGAGSRFSLSRKAPSVTFDIRYSLGFPNICKSEDEFYKRTIKTKNLTMALGVSF